MPEPSDGGPEAMTVRVKLKGIENTILIRVDADEWAEVYECARGSNGMIQIHEDGRTLAIKAREIILWESISEPDERESNEADDRPCGPGNSFNDASPRRKRVADALQGFLLGHDDPLGRLALADRALAAARAVSVNPQPVDALPDDLRAVLEDPGVIVRQDAAVFELIAKWQQAKCLTESSPVNPEERQ